MNKLKILGFMILFFGLTIVSVGCDIKTDRRQEIDTGSKKITILSGKDESSESANDLSVEKIIKYEEMKGEDWLSDNLILITKENSKMEPIKVFDQMSNIRNMYSYDLKSGEEKNIFNESEYMWGPIVSPNKKYIFVERAQPDKNSSIILDMSSKVKAMVEDDIVKGFHISFNDARWIDDEEVIVPSSDDGVSLINVDSNISEIKNIGKMQNHAAKLGDKIYYVSPERNLVSYDINTKENRVVKEDVLDFELSPKKDMFAIEKKVSESKEALVLIDLDGNEKRTIAEAKTVFGISWSPNQSKIAYIIISDNESKNGLYVNDIEINKSIYISSDFVGIENGLKWNPSSNKILASIGEVKEMKAIDNTYIISLND